MNIDYLENVLNATAKAKKRIALEEHRRCMKSFKYSTYVHLYNNSFHTYIKRTSSRMAAQEELLYDHANRIKMWLVDIWSIKQGLMLRHQRNGQRFVLNCVKPIRGMSFSCVQSVYVTLECFTLYTYKPTCICKSGKSGTWGFLPPHER